VESKKIAVAEQHLQAIRQGMFESVNTEDGAGKRAQQRGLSIAGKTGTAEFRRADGVWDEHAWFTGYMPADDPKYVITVFFDRGVGGDKGAPIAGMILKYIHENLPQ
jgi:penicillin-binding protein 2